MDSSSTDAANLLLLANLCADQSAAGENSVNNAPVASTVIECSMLSIRPKGGSIYSGVNRAKDNDNLYSSFAYVKKKGRSVYLGRYESEEEAARAHDIVTLKCSGAKGKLNFPASDYTEIMRMTREMDADELIAHVKYHIKKGGSKYHGVMRHVETGRWLALHYIGTFGTEEEAAMAYDVEEIRMRGWNAVTNFSLSLYDVEGIRAGNAHPRITIEVAKYLQQATICLPFGGAEQYAGASRFIIPAQNHPSYGYRYIVVPRVDASSRTYSETVMDLLSAHPNFQATNMANSSAQQGRAALVNKFCHSSSSLFKPYKRN